MNNKSNKSSNKNLGFADVLTIVFVVLKLVGVINWSWVWVLSPIWITLILLILIEVFLKIVGDK